MKISDVIIVGGGPAGASCAKRLRAGGLDPLILDKEAFPRQKPCAGWVTPEVFGELGCDAGDYPHGLTHFKSFVITIKGIQFHPKVHQYAIRRIEFDEWLLAQSGARVKKHHVRSINRVEEGFVLDDTYQCTYLVGAGGTHCPVEKILFEEQYPHPKMALITALEAEFPFTASDARCHLWFFENQLPGYMWYVPKAEGHVNIGVGGKALKMHARGKSIKDYWDVLVEKLQSTGLIGGDGFRPIGWSYYLRHKGGRVRDGNAFIVGDAAGLATLDMGEGIRTAIASGKMAADAILHEKEYAAISLPKYSLPSLMFGRR